MARGTKEKINNPKILINLRMLQQPYTGVQSYIFNLTRNLLRLYPDITIRAAVVNYKDDNKAINELKQYPNFELINHLGPRASLYGILFDIFFINKYISSHDLYFCPVNILPLIKNKKTPQVVGVLDLCTFIVPETTSKPLKLYYDLYLRISLKRADKIITISHNTKSDLSKLFNLPSTLIEVVHLGIDSDLSKKPSPKETKSYLKLLGISKEKYFLSIGTSKRKNIETVIDAFAVHSLTHQDHKIVIIAHDSNMIDLITKRVKERNITNRVIITKKYIGPHQLQVLYRNAIALIYCPHYEGFGLPALEAMINKCPAVISNNSSLTEIGKDGAILVNHMSPKDISNAMGLLTIDKQYRKKIIYKGLKNARNYSWDKTAKEVMRVFLEQLK